jgi:uncharacterized membrane protein YphA (DoxX/SURF4 family)
MTEPTPPPGRWPVVLGWLLRVASATIFAWAGYAKLAGDPHMIAVFDSVGIGQWFRYLTGALEVGGAIGLLIPRLVAPAAAMLACVMAGALFSHLFLIGGSPVLAVVLLGAMLTVAALNRDGLRFRRS